MDTSRVRRFAELTSLKRQAKATLAEIQEEMDKIQDEVLTAMSAEGVSSLRVDTSEGRFTVSPRRQIWAGVEEGQKLKAVQVLEALGLQDLVSPNYQSLSSWVREHEEVGRPLPKEFEGVIAVREVFSLGVRKAGNGK